jgi:hypothetical protein
MRRVNGELRTAIRCLSPVHPPGSSPVQWFRAGIRHFLAKRASPAFPAHAHFFVTWRFCVLVVDLPLAGTALLRLATTSRVEMLPVS